jgi:hypothetical protein
LSNLLLQGMAKNTPPLSSALAAKRGYMNKTLILVVVMSFLTISGCFSQVSLIQPVSDGKKTYQEFISSNSFPYSMQEDRKNQISNSYDKLKIGMTKHEVNLILEDPDCSEHRNTKQYPWKYLGTTWKYYFYKPYSNLVNEKLDKGILIFFDTNDKVQYIYPQNIEGLNIKESTRQ